MAATTMKTNASSGQTRQELLPSTYGFFVRHRNSPTRTIGRSGKWCIGLKPDLLETLLCETIPKRTDLREFLVFQGIANRFRLLGFYDGFLDEEFSSVAEMLVGLLEHPASRQLSNTELADVHSTIGMIQYAWSHDDDAIQSFVKALWLVYKPNKSLSTSQPPVPKEQIAVILYRLGSVYGRTGDFEQMKYLMEKAATVRGERDLVR
jgi:hypothetical protein